MLVLLVKRILKFFSMTVQNYHRSNIHITQRITKHQIYWNLSWDLFRLPYKMGATLKNYLPFALFAQTATRDDVIDARRQTRT